MQRFTIVRGCFLVVGVVCLLLTAGFAFPNPAVTWLWPWPDGPLSYLFVASILAAFGCGSLLVAWNSDWRSAAGGGIALLVGFGGMAAMLTSLAIERGGGGLVGHAAGFWTVAALGAALWIWGARDAGVDTRPIPLLVKLSSWAFAAALFAASIALVRKTPAIFPWPLKPESSVLYGWMFLGLSLSYFYLALRGYWGDAKVSLIGFLVYDLVLIWSFLKLFASVQPDHWLSLVLYTAVLIYSGALAVYYLFIDSKWRLVTG